MSSNNITNAGSISASSFTGNGSALTNVPGDNLGNHTATQNVKLNGKWLSNDGGNEGVYVTTDGQVGVGTSSITSGKKLHVNGDTKIVGSLQITGGSPSSGDVLTSDGSGNASWQNSTTPEIAKATGSFSSSSDNDSWHDVTEWSSSFGLSSGSMFKVEGKADLRLTEGTADDYFEVRVRYKVGSNNYYSSLISYHQQGNSNHNLFHVVPYIDLIEPDTYGGNAQFSLQVRNLGDDNWEAANCVIVVTKY